jgi:beta-phosphoglucomutase
MAEPKTAILFDMDGVLVDNMSYHIDAWKSFCNTYRIRLTDDEITNYVNGRIAKEVLEYLFKKSLSTAEVARYSEEKEKIYREHYKPHIKPTEGLLTFLQSMQDKGVLMAVATSAPPANVGFTLDSIGVKHFFSAIVDATFVERGKPDPQIYLTTAGKLHAEPSRCIVFEDSLSGVQSGLNAGMKVIAISTTHTKEELQQQQPHLIISNFTEVDYGKIQSLLAAN